MISFRTHIRNTKHDYGFCTQPKHVGLFISVKFCVYTDFQMYCQISLKLGDRGGTVVKVLCDNSEGRWFDPSLCRWNFSLI